MTTYNAKLAFIFSKKSLIKSNWFWFKTSITRAGVTNKTIKIKGKKQTKTIKTKQGNPLLSKIKKWKKCLKMHTIFQICPTNIWKSPICRNLMSGNIPFDQFLLQQKHPKLFAYQLCQSEGLSVTCFCSFPWYLYSLFNYTVIKGVDLCFPFFLISYSVWCNILNLRFAYNVK